MDQMFLYLPVGMVFTGLLCSDNVLPLKYFILVSNLLKCFNLFKNLFVFDSSVCVFYMLVYFSRDAACIFVKYIKI
jgi:hypothetical protein